MDYPCGKFDDCGQNRFFLSCRQIHRDTHTQRELHTDAAERFTPATVVGVSKDGLQEE